MRFLFLASDRKACSLLKPVSRVLVWIMWVQVRLARTGQVVVCSLDHCRDSYWRVRSRIRWRSAIAALSAVMELHLLAMSIARNMRDKKVGKSRRRRVGRCLGFMEMVPVAGSMTML